MAPQTRTASGPVQPQSTLETRRYVPLTARAAAANPVVQRAAANGAAIQPFALRPNVIQLIPWENAIPGSYYLVNGTRRKLNDKYSGWLFFEGLEKGVRASDVEDDDSSSDDETSMLTDFESDEERTTLTSINNLEEMRKGKDKQEQRLTDMKSFGHFNSSKALAYQSQLAMGVGPSKQSTVSTWYGETTTVYNTSSCAPLKQYVEEQHPNYEYVQDVRKHFGTGTHIHSEMFGLSNHLETHGKIVAVGIVVNKPCCPVCAEVLKEFGVPVWDDLGGNGQYFDAWRNPWSLLKNPTEKEKAWRAKANKAALKHLGKGCKIYQ